MKTSRAGWDKMHEKNAGVFISGVFEGLGER
jgi:hypothetical protein